MITHGNKEVHNPNTGVTVWSCWFYFLFHQIMFWSADGREGLIGGGGGLIPPHIEKMASVPPLDFITDASVETLSTNTVTDRSQHKCINTRQQSHSINRLNRKTIFPCELKMWLLFIYYYFIKQLRLGTHWPIFSQPIMNNDINNFQWW